MPMTKIVRYPGTASYCSTFALALLGCSGSGVESSNWDAPSSTESSITAAPEGTATHASMGTFVSDATPGHAAPENSGASSEAAPNSSSTPVTPASSCASAGTKVPFRVMTRLNRAEYDNTVRDLLGDETHLAFERLPADTGDGAFDNNAAALSINPALFETYVALADELATRAVTQGHPGRDMLVTCDLNGGSNVACINDIISTFGRRAFRRPLTSDEVALLGEIYDQALALNLSVDDALAAVVKAMLVSPHFIFRPEINADVNAAGNREANPFELATRLSYFVWSSMPDDALLSAAMNNQLNTAADVQRELTRLLQSPKAEALYTRFPGLWLQTLDIDHERPPAPAVYPAWNDELAMDMQAETAAFMRAFMTEDVDFLGFLSAKFSFLNQRLADFYGVSGAFGNELQRVELSGEQRGGILTHGSVLRVTSFSERTSPVVRGQWILARVLNSPPPPPPADLTIPSLEEDGSAVTPTTTREKLELHRQDPRCAACHALMDPLGFGLEHYDAIGAWRTEENGVPVVAGGTLADGTVINDARELAAALELDPRTSRSVASFLLSYALGRVIGPDDKCRVDALDVAFTASGHRFQALLSQVVESDAFLTRTMGE